MIVHDYLGLDIPQVWTIVERDVSPSRQTIEAALRDTGNRIQWRSVTIFYEDVLRALDAAAIRFVLVGGVAVILHGVPRTTADLDLVIDLEEGNVRRFVGVMVQLGFVPRAPVAAADLASADHRRAWVADKHMMAFTFHRPGRPLEEVDILIDPPLPFAELAAGAVLLEAEGLRLPIVGIRHLIRMKEHAGRAQDVADVDALRRLLEASGE